MINVRLFFPTLLLGCGRAIDGTAAEELDGSESVNSEISVLESQESKTDDGEPPGASGGDSSQRSSSQSDEDGASSGPTTSVPDSSAESNQKDPPDSDPDPDAPSVSENAGEIQWERQWSGGTILSVTIDPEQGVVLGGMDVQEYPMGYVGRLRADGELLWDYGWDYGDEPPTFGTHHYTSTLVDRRGRIVAVAGLDIAQSLIAIFELDGRFVRQYSYFQTTLYDIIEHPSANEYILVGGNSDDVFEQEPREYTSLILRLSDVLAPIEELKDCGPAHSRGMGLVLDDADNIMTRSILRSEIDGRGLFETQLNRCQIADGLPSRKPRILAKYRGELNIFDGINGGIARRADGSVFTIAQHKADSSLLQFHTVEGANDWRVEIDGVARALVARGNSEILVTGYKQNRVAFVERFDRRGESIARYQYDTSGVSAGDGIYDIELKSENTAVIAGSREGQMWVAEIQL